jgi:hypothetical protein
MNRYPVQWSPITDTPNLYGYRVSAPNVRATSEVVRCYSGDWAVFCYVDGKQVAGFSEATGGHVYATARKHAAAFVRHWVGA